MLVYMYVCMFTYHTNTYQLHAHFDKICRLCVQHCCVQQASFALSFGENKLLECIHTTKHMYIYIHTYIHIYVYITIIYAYITNTHQQHFG